MTKAGTIEEMQEDALDSALSRLALIGKEAASIRDHLKTPGNLSAAETYNMTVHVNSLTHQVSVLRTLAIVAKELPRTPQAPQETLAAVRDKEPARYAKARDMYKLRKRQTGSLQEWENLTVQSQLNWTEMAARFTEQEG